MEVAQNYPTGTYAETNPETDRDTDMPQMTGTDHQGLYLLQMRNVEGQASREHS